jgi:hypothetical protein
LFFLTYISKYLRGYLENLPNASTNGGSMRFVKGAVVLGLAVSFCLAQMNISGTVTDSLTGAGVLGAKVNLKNAGIFVTTDFSGAFTLSRTNSATSTIGQNSQAAVPNVPVLSAQGEIKLSLQDAARVTVKTYSAQGKQIASVARIYSAGNHSIMPAKANTGIYLYQVVVNGKAYTLQQANINGRAYAKANVNGNAVAASQGLAKSAAGLAFADSLIISKSWYNTQKKALTDSVVSGLTFKMRANAQECPFATSAYTGVANGGYYIDNNTWNGDTRSQITQDLYVCSYKYWYVILNTKDVSTTACKSYPNVHKDYNPPVRFSAFSALSADFESSGPHEPDMDYEMAFDIWTNGVATLTCTEFMIFNDNWYQLPAGTKQFRTTIDGHQYDIYRARQPNGIGQNLSHLALIPYQSGHQDLLAFFNHAIAMGWLPDTSTLCQLDYGFEIASTNNRPATFLVSNFEINETLK